MSATRENDSRPGAWKIRGPCPDCHLVSEPCHYLPEYRHVQFLDPQRDVVWQPPAGIDRVLVFDLEMRAHGDSETWTYQPLTCAEYGLHVSPGAGVSFAYDSERNQLRATR